MSRTTKSSSALRTPSPPKAKKGGNWWDREPEAGVEAVVSVAEDESIPWWERNSYMNLAQRQAAAAALEATTPTVVAPPLGSLATTRATPPASPKARTPSAPRTPRPPKVKKGGNWWDREPEPDAEVVVSSVAITAAASLEPASASPKAASRAPGSVLSACAAAASSASTPGKGKSLVQPTTPPRVAQAAERAKAPKPPTSPASPGRSSGRTTKPPASPASPGRNSARTTRAKPTSPTQGKGRGRGRGKGKANDKWWMEDRSSEPAQPEENGKASGTSSPASSTSPSLTSTTSGMDDSGPSTPPRVLNLSIKGAAAKGNKPGTLALADGISVSADASEKVVRKKASWEEEEKKAKAFAGLDWSEIV